MIAALVLAVTATQTPAVSQTPVAPPAPDVPVAPVPPVQVGPDVAPDIPPIHIPEIHIPEIHIPPSAQGPEFPFPPFYIPDEVIGLILGSLAMVVLMIVGYPIARAIARRIDRQSVAAAPPSADVVARLERIEHAVETIAIEVERISEGQRYTTRVVSEHMRELKAGVDQER